MAIYYVDVIDGDDGNLGTSEGSGNAWQSIGKAMDTLAQGDTVYIKSSGDYTTEHGSSGAIGELQIVGAWNGQISIIGYTDTIDDGGVATLNAASSLTNCLTEGSIESTGLNYAFKNLRFTGATSHGCDMLLSDRMLFVNCQADNNGGYGFATDDAIGFSKCISFNNASNGFEVGTGGHYFSCVAYLNGGNGMRQVGWAANCLSYHNTGTQIGSSTLFVGITNCTVDGDGVSPGIQVTNAFEKVYNCIIYNCSTGITGSVNSVDISVSLNNLYFGNTANKLDWPDHASDIESDPLFVDADNNDYRLSSISPALEAGIDSRELTNSESYIDIGALQAEPTGGGGSAGGASVIGSSIIGVL